MAMNKAVVGWKLGLSGGNDPQFSSISKPSNSRELNSLSFNYKEPKSLSFNYKESKSLNLNSKPKFGCCFSSSSPSSSTATTNPFPKLSDLNLILLPEYFINFWVRLFCPKVRYQVVTLRIKLLDEDGVLNDKFGQISLDPSKGGLHVHTSIVLDKFVPCLLDNADRWISSCFLVAGGFIESCFKALRSDLAAMDLPFPEDYQLVSGHAQFNSTHTRCTEVIINIQLSSGIDEKLEGISTKEDLKVFLQQLNSVENMISLVAMRHIVLVRKEKTTTFSHYKM